MKKFLIFSVLLLFASASHPQGYVPIPADSTSVWRLQVQVWEPSPWWMVTDERIYFFGGDTVIGTRTYDKLYASGIRYVTSSPGSPGYPYTHEYRGCMRNEGGKVYYHTWDMDTLLYDFTVQAGSHLPVTWINDTGIMVSSIDSVLVGSKYRKRFNLAGPVNGALLSHWIIEGMGHELGLVEPMYGMPDYGSNFNCYAENSAPLFPPGVICDITIGTEEKPSPAPVISVFPNPSPGNFSISIKEGNSQPVTWRINRVTGEQVSGGTRLLNDGKMEVSGLSLENGIYFLFLQPGCSGPVFVSKLIIRK